MIDRYLYFSRRPQAVARVRAQGCRRAEGQQAGRSHQDRRPQQEVASGRGCHGRPAGVPRLGRSADRGDHRELGPRTGAGRGHRSRQAEEGPCGSGHHRRYGSVRRPARHRHRHSERLPADRHPEDLGHRRGCRRHFRSAGHHGFRPAGGHPGRHGVQLLHRACRSFRRGDG